jgi:hypothetical protein
LDDEKKKKEPVPMRIAIVLVAGLGEADKKNDRMSFRWALPEAVTSHASWSHVSATAAHCEKSRTRTD